jgi:hypothetical protein
MNVAFGSVFAVQWKPTAAYHDAAVHEAEIGQYSSFAVRDTLTFERPDSS